MSEQEQNIELVKKGYEAFTAGDIDTVMSLFDDSIEWVQPGDSAISGTYHGKAELGQFIRRLAEKSTTATVNREKLAVARAELTAAEERVRGRDFLNMRGDLVPFLRLRNLFDVTGEPDRYQKIVIASAGETRVGLIVDQIIGSHQSVIKSLSKLHSDVTMFSGATILGDGSAALILDVAQLMATGHSLGETKSISEAA